MKVLEDFAIEVRVQMARQGLTQKDLAHRTGMSAAHLSLLLNQRRNMSLERATQIADALDCDLHIVMERKQ